MGAHRAPRLKAATATVVEAGSRPAGYDDHDAERWVDGAEHDHTGGSGQKGGSGWHECSQ